MQEPELHDLSDNAEVVYMKDNVSIHGAMLASERISGRLRLIKKGSCLFMTWIPYSNAMVCEKDRIVYTMREVPLTEVRSIRRHTGWQYIIVVLASGLALPPLYLYNGGVKVYNGGVKEFLATIKQHVSIVISAEDANVFLVNDSQNFLTTIISRQRQKVHDHHARDLSIQVLEKFSLVTKFARETTRQLFCDSNNVSDKSPVLSPLGCDEWYTLLDSQGRIMDSEALRKRVFYGGVEHKLRKEVWPFLLGHYAYDSTYTEREYVKAMKKAEFETLKKQWRSISPEQSIIDKDVVRTDRCLSFYNGDDNPNVNLLHDILLTYSFYNFDLGYCQGMSDLLSPILFVLGDESESFWCFVKLMERLGPNFNRDQKGIKSQLLALTKLVELLDRPLHNYFTQRNCLDYYFCFRWVLLQFKREFEFDKTLRFWEAMWTHYPSEHLHLYVCVAILKRYRSKIIGEQMDYDTLFKFINELSGQINLDGLVRDAEALWICAGEKGDACISCIPPGTPPSLPAC